MAKGRPDEGVLRIGHRGACGHSPENTLASIEQAIVMGCALTEVDVRRTADGMLVLLHDERVDRTTNGRGHIAKLTLADIQKLDAGSGQSIPLLREALSAGKGRIGFILELKMAGLVDDACAVVRAGGFTGQVIYASFLDEELQHVRRTDPDSRTLILFKRPIKNPEALAARVEATHVGLRCNVVTKPLVESLHRAHLTVFVYTVNKPGLIQRMRKCGVDGIVSDFPDRL